MTAPADKSKPESKTAMKLPKPLWFAGIILLTGVGVLAWIRGGMLALPDVPGDLTLEAAGLAQLQQMKELNAAIWSGSNSVANTTPLSEGARLVKSGLAAHARGEHELALDQIRQGVRLQPDNLVLANAYRMVVFGLRRDFLRSARQGLALTPQFPPHLARQPIAFFEELDQKHSSRETKLHLALAWVDEMLLFPALEIKAPSSVQAVDLLTDVLEKDNPNYVPALFARGLNHLHRPSRLVWPESAKTPRDAAVRDIGKCVAIGRQFTVGSERLKATLALSLGDAYVKAGKAEVARSWWQIAQNLCREDQMQASVRKRYGWQNEVIVDRLEEELDQSRGELEHPMTDLALIWN